MFSKAFVSSTWGEVTPNASWDKSHGHGGGGREVVQSWGGRGGHLSPTRVKGQPAGGTHHTGMHPS